MEELRLSGKAGEVVNICAESKELLSAGPAGGLGWGDSGPPRGSSEGEGMAEKLSAITCWHCKKVGKLSVCSLWKLARYCTVGLSGSSVC